MLAVIAAGDSPKAAASRARVRLRQQEAGCRSSLDTVCALIPASLLPGIAPAGGGVPAAAGHR